jgi:hypothetical protein
MKFEIEGEIGYAGPDDPTGEYYYLHTKDGKTIYIGVDAEKFGGNIYDGIPGFPKDYKKCKLTIEFIE